MGVGGVGILGGTFDPPHNGHVALARTALERFELDRLLVRVVADPGHKRAVAGAADRLALAELAFGSLPRVEVSLDPYARTVESLEALGLDDPLFLLGADEFAAFPTWTRPERVVELARLGVATRPGYAADSVEGVLAALADPGRVELFTIDPWPVSSSEVRARVGRGEPVDDAVPPAVAAEIGRRGLYRLPAGLH